MGMNFNISNKPEYNLYKNLTHEEINLYGLPCKYIITTKNNKDFIWGEYSHLTIDDNKIFEINIKLGNVEGWNTDNVFSKFGLSGLDTNDVYISAITMETIHPSIVDLSSSGWDEILGNLLVFPNGKIMEVTDFKQDVEGQSNLFPYSDKKNLYKLIVKQYVNNSDETTQDLKEEIPSFTNLEHIFSVDTDRKEIQEETLSSTRVITNNVFGDLG